MTGKYDIESPERIPAQSPEMKQAQYPERMPAQSSEMKQAQSPERMPAQSSEMKQSFNMEKPVHSNKKQMIWFKRKSYKVNIKCYTAVI